MSHPFKPSADCAAACLARVYQSMGFTNVKTQAIVYDYDCEVRVDVSVVCPDGTWIRCYYEIPVEMTPSVLAPWLHGCKKTAQAWLDAPPGTLKPFEKEKTR